ncbi:MAG: hypothetical protein QOD72_767 [Acidimicrobiaceae bacterium]|nr:hypothetical protein [Acidimicrobiaceae bacterium]
MRGSVLRGGRIVYRDDLPEPVPGPGQVLVDIKACGICGSDLHFAKHGADVFMGHEFSAEILDAGPGTEAPPAGTLVTSVPVLLSQTGVEMIVYSNTTLGG